MTQEKFKNDGKDVIVEWEVGPKFDDAGDGHTSWHEATGYDNDGNEYEGTATLVDGMIVEIELEG